MLTDGQMNGDDVDARKYLLPLGQVKNNNNHNNHNLHNQQYKLHKMQSSSYGQKASCGAATVEFVTNNIR
jgi:hypothetical protein